MDQKNKMGFQHWRLINQVQAKEFINPGGPPVFKLHFLGGQWGLINPAGVINPDLTYIYIYYAIMLCIFGMNIHLILDFDP